MRKGTLYVFTGPSGAGKGTVLSRLLSEDEKLFFSISATTRAPRPGEKDGVQYYFLTKEDFEAKIAANAFLEHAKYVDNYYGTLEAPVNEKLELIRVRKRKSLSKILRRVTSRRTVPRHCCS